MFPRSSGTLVTILPVAAMVLGCLAVGAPVATADEPVLHHVKYTVFTDLPGV